MLTDRSRVISRKFFHRKTWIKAPRASSSPAERDLQNVGGGGGDFFLPPAAAPLRGEETRASSHRRRVTNAQCSARRSILSPPPASRTIKGRNQSCRNSEAINGRCVCVCVFSYEFRVLECAGSFSWRRRLALILGSG